MTPKMHPKRSSRLLLCWSLLLLGSFLAGPAHSGQLSDIEYVIQVSVDGVNADMLTTEMAAAPPGASDTTSDYDNWHRLVDEGASTFNARTDYSHTWTLPNHTSMLTGRPVAQPSGQPNTAHHNYTDNGEPGAGTTLHNNHPNVAYIAGSFDVAHDNGLSTGHFASKSKFVLYNQTWEDNGGSDLSTPPDEGSDKIDFTVNKDSNHFSGSIVDSWDMHQDFLTDQASNHREYVFLHYVDPDKSGHESGWGTAQYYTTLQQVDDYLKDVFALVETDATLMGKTAIIVTSDHGGGVSQPASHGCETCPEHYTIPFFVWGPGIQTAADLYALNTGIRSDPGTGRPDYNASPQPIRNADAGNLALQLLGLPAIPGSQSNAAQDIALGPCAVDADCDDANACTDDACSAGTCSNTNNSDPCDDASVCTLGDVCSGGVCASSGPLDCDDADVCTADSCDDVLGCAHDPIPGCGTGGSNEFTAYNDCVYDASVPSGTDPNGQTVHYTATNVTAWGIGNIAGDYTGTAHLPAGSAYPNTTGLLVDYASGTPTSVTATFSQNPAASVIWQPQVAAAWTGGYDTALGTDARNTFGGIADMTGTSYYGASGWYVDLTLTGLDPSKLYTFASSASRAQANTTGLAGYPDRITIYTLSGDNTSNNASTAGVTVISPTSVSFSTGNNHAAGYVARWTDIDPGADGTVVIRAEPDLTTGTAGNEHKAYAFDVFTLAQQTVCGDGAVGGSEECDDGNTADGDCCSSTCEFETSGSACDDADACTTLDTCDGAGACVVGGPLDCDDSDVCTDDSCDPLLGCEYVNNTAPCSDGNACTVSDVCGGGACTSGGPLDCDDANGCTDDSCDTGLGCQYANNTDPCDDSDVCTVGDSCGGGSCQAGGPLGL